MNEMNDFDIEIQDLKDAEPEHFDGNVAIAGTPVILTPTTTRSIQLAFVNVPSVRDPDTPNTINDAIKVIIDGGAKSVTLMSGESQHFPGSFTSLKLDTNNNGTNYQVILWS